MPNVTSRYRILEAPIRVPGKCKFCGSAKGPVIDTLVEIDYEGSLYICIKCAKEIGLTAGLVAPTKEEIDDKFAIEESVKDGLLDSIIDAIHNVIDNTDLLRIVPEDTDTGSGDSKESTGSSKESTKSSSSKRSNDVSDDSGDGADIIGGDKQDFLGI